MIQIAICDDDKQDLVHLKSMICKVMDRFSKHYNIQEYESGEALLKTPLTFHLIFLDIMMDGENGIEIGKQIYRKNRNVKVVYQTSYGQYCIDAMNKSHAFAFLEKPLQYLEVEEQITEFLEQRNSVEEIRIEFRNVRYKRNGKVEEAAILNLAAKDILYFEYIKMQKSVRIVTNKEEYTYKDTMNKLKERVYILGFEICCRGLIVNLERVKKIKGYNVILDTGEMLPLSQRRVAEFKERVNEYIHDSYY